MVEKEFTELDDKKAKKEKTPKQKDRKFTVTEINEKLDIMFMTISKFFGKEYIFRPDDFEQESKAIIRLTEKFPVVGSVIEIIDPILAILGLYVKWTRLKDKAVKGDNPQKEDVKNAKTFTS